MVNPELAQLELLSRIDQLLEDLRTWTSAASHWQPVRQQQRFLSLLVERLEPLRSRLESPLVVATFGGTGSGKSSLVNALLGEVVTTAGRQRPTTTQPVLIAHPETVLETYGLPTDSVRVIRRDLPLLRDLVLIDCPDPDTTEDETAGSNLERLHALLPWCDVLLCISTQEKYRSAKVSDELRQAAAGCRMVFVQTHADRDDDIRDDWRRQLAGDYDVSEMFLVDSHAALAQRQRGQNPDGEFGRLMELLLHELSATRRIRIRRANLLGLFCLAVDRSVSELTDCVPRVEQIDVALRTEEVAIRDEMSQRLQTELLESRAAWERRLLGRVVEVWGASPFSLLLRLYHQQAIWLGSLGLMRARSTAQLAIWGALQGSRWWITQRQDDEAEARTRRPTGLSPTEENLRKAKLVIDGYTREAGFDASAARMTDATNTAGRLEGDFLDDVGSRIDGLIQDLARQHTWWWPRLVYETGFCLLPAFLLYRMGRNFFYDSFWAVPPAPLLSTDFYLPALIFLLAWCAIWLMLYLRRLGRGLKARIQKLSADLAAARFTSGLFPDIREACQEFTRQLAALEQLAARARLSRDSAGSEGGRLAALKRSPATHDAAPRDLTVSTPGVRP